VSEEVGPEVAVRHRRLVGEDGGNGSGGEVRSKPDQMGQVKSSQVKSGTHLTSLGSLVLLVALVCSSVGYGISPLRVAARASA
jgi:hypothetical protein